MQIYIWFYKFVVVSYRFESRFLGEGRTYLVTTVTAIFKTLIPYGKSRNQLQKALWNKGLIFAVYKSCIKHIKLIKSMHFDIC